MINPESSERSLARNRTFPRPPNGLSIPVLAALAATLVGPSMARTAPVPERIGFNEHIRPIFNKNCVACHGGVKRSEDLSFIYRESALGEERNGTRVIQPGAPERSRIIDRILSDDPEERMPPPEHGSALSKREAALIEKWIAQGAAWEEHWSFIPPRPTAPPEVRDSRWPRESLDHFVLARLESEAMQPSPEADRAMWLRRVSFDLTGLPPTPEEIRTFADDPSPDAYENVVDRLLASPDFGERWATPWLDLARYADTMGYEKDPKRTIWPYRDWVIRALNADMPFDQFTIKQLAGDLLPEPEMDDLIATAFHRNSQTNTEGGTDDEEFRIAAVIDRVNSTWQTWQGTSFSCVQCHSHPYDPIEQEDYYRFAAFFNTSQDADLRNDPPLLPVPSDSERYAEARELDVRISALRKTRFERVGPLARNANLWQALRLDKAESTGMTELQLHPSSATVEVHASGAISVGSRYTLEAPMPEGVNRLTALRIDALPLDVQAALANPQDGFVVSRLQLYVLDPTDMEAPPSDGEIGGNGSSDSEAEVPESEGSELADPREIELSLAFADEAEPMLDPEDSFRDNAGGWGVFSKQFHPRHGVFLPSEPVELAAGSRLRLVIEHRMVAPGSLANVIKRGHFSISDAEEWAELVRDPELIESGKRLAEFRKRRDEIPGVAMPVMAERDEKFRRSTYVFLRGNWMEKGEEVQTGVPDIFPPLSDDEAPDRLAMASWLVSPDNPLTARVTVNRFWQQLFGAGLVETLEDFGSAGAAPSHPELLDFLALRFQNEHRWSIKQLLREIVLSATYRQDNKVTPELLEHDPGNRLLARGPRGRLTAEMIRDQALVVAGLRSHKRFGPPVMPPQPEGIWRSVYSNAKWETSEGEDKHRRAIYTFVKRTSGYPGFLTFDAPSREVCTQRRIPTNTPLQALVTLNDEVFIEAARGLAEEMMTRSDDPAEQIRHGFLRAAGHSPSPGSAEDLLALYRGVLDIYREETEAAEKLGDTPEAAAMVSVANAILNLDLVLTK